MRILFIAPRFPLPADTGGKIRTFNILKGLASRHRVDLVCFSFDPRDRDHVRTCNELGVDVTFVNAREDGLLSKAVQVLFSAQPYSVAKYYDTGMADALRDLTQKNKYDFIHFDHIHTAHYLHDIDGVPGYVDEHNVEYRIAERCAGVEKNPLKRMVFSSQASKMKAFERIQLCKAAVCGAVSEDDAAVLRKLTGEAVPVYVLPNGVDTDYFDLHRLNPRPDEEDALVYTGSMDWLPNDDAMQYFIRDIFPLVRKARPGVKLYIVGKSPSAELEKLKGSDENIIITGRVEDVRPYVARSKVFLTPLRIGGGTRLKILEAMSMGRAVVSTAIGAEGIDYSDGSDIHIADAPEDFAQAVLDLMNDAPRRQEMGRAGRQLVMDRYDWRIIARTLEEVYQRHA